MTSRRILALAAAALVGCAHPASLRPAWPDAPIELRDDADREQAIDHLWVMPPGGARDLARQQIAEAIAHRIRVALEDDQPFTAAALLDQLTWLWHADPAAAAGGLARHAELFAALRATFARSGALEPTVQLLILLSEVEPAARAEHLAELDEVLGFADELAMAENGPAATRAQPIALLSPTALALPLPWLVDRYVALQIDRQRAVAAVLEHERASMPLVRAHHDFLSTSRRIANVLARAGRSAEIHRQLARLAPGYGTDRELMIRAEVIADQPTAGAYAALAHVLEADDHAPDPTAALAVCMAGLAAFPGAPELLAAGASSARALGRIDQAIALSEQALRGAGEIDPVSALRLGKLYAERIQRLATSGRPNAAAAAWKQALGYTSRLAQAHPHSVWQQAAAIAESALGHGLASQGMLDEARHALTASIERAPSIEAYEMLVKIGVQTDQYADAQKWADAGLAMLGNQTLGDRYRRARLERLAADSLRRAGKLEPATQRYRDSLRAWDAMGDAKDLPPTIAAERQLDKSRSLWSLGDPEGAIALVMESLDQAPASEELAASAVAFLIQAGRYRDALDAFHGSLGQPAISEYHKVYMSLWIVGEAARLGEPRDQLAADYLAGRKGDVWHGRLAQLAAGALTIDEVRPLATTGPRRAELAFYGAMLGLDPRARTPAGRQQLLREVVAAHLVLDAEYDLARLYLSRP